MRRLLCSLILLAAAIGIASPAGARDFQVGDLVVAVADSKLKVRRQGRVEITDAVFPGVTMRVGAVEGRWLWVSNGLPGWIKNNEVIPLDAAIDYFTDRIDNSPADPRWRYARAVAWTNQREWDIAIADYDELIKLRRVPAFYHVRGICFHSKGEYDRAISDFNEAIRLDPRSARYYNSRGEAWLEKKQYVKALSDCDQAIRLEPNLASAYTNRGQIHEAQGDVGLAIDEYKKSLKLDPNYDLAYIRYAWLLATSDEEVLRDGPLAVKFAERACKLTNWDDPHALGTLAAAYAEAGQFDEAVKWEQKAQSLYPPEVKAKWAFLLEWYEAEKPYRRSDEPAAG